MAACSKVDFPLLFGPASKVSGSSAPFVFFQGREPFPPAFLPARDRVITSQQVVDVVCGSKKKAGQMSARLFVECFCFGLEGEAEVGASEPSRS